MPIRDPTNPCLLRTDPPSGVASCAVTLALSNTDDEFVQNFVGAGVGHLQVLDPFTSGPTLADGVSIDASLSCVSNAGFVMDVSAPLSVVDASPPKAGSVFDGPQGQSLEAHSSTSTVAANWVGFVDSHSSIAGYTVCYGTVAGTCDVSTPVDAGGALFATVPVSGVSDGDTVFATVFATNNVGLATNVSSNGVLLDSSPPDTSGARVFNGHNLLSEGVVQHDDLRVSWVRSGDRDVAQLRGPQLICYFVCVGMLRLALRIPTRVL